MKKLVLSEKKIVVVLFVLVLIVFSFAQQDTKKIEKMYLESNSPVTSFDKSTAPKLIIPLEESTARVH